MTIWYTDCVAYYVYVLFSDMLIFLQCFTTFTPLPINVCSCTYLLIPWCRVLLEKLTGLQLVKKFPAFYGTCKFITALTSFRHLSLSWASPIQSTHPQPTSWRSILILSTHLCLGLPSGHFSSGFPTRTLCAPLSSPTWSVVVLLHYNRYPFSLYFICLTFRHHASCILGQAFHCSPENAFYIFNQQIYFII